MQMYERITRLILTSNGAYVVLPLWNLPSGTPPLHITVAPILMDSVFGTVTSTTIWWDSVATVLMCSRVLPRSPRTSNSDI